MNGKVAYLFFLTAGIVGIILVLIFHIAQLTQPQQDILSATLGGLLMALQSCVHSLYQGNGPPTPTSAVTPQKATP